jgi:hypothetical protein
VAWPPPEAAGLDAGALAVGALVAVLVVAVLVVVGDAAGLELGLQPASATLAVSEIAAHKALVTIRMAFVHRSVSEGTRHGSVVLVDRPLISGRALVGSRRAAGSHASNTRRSHSRFTAHA